MPATDSELDIAEPEDFFVTRDSNDNLQPVEQQLPGVEQAIRVVPLTMGDVNAYGEGDGQLNPADVDAETTAEILNEHWYDVRSRDDFEVTAETVAENMIGYGSEALLTAILRASGYDLQNAINMENMELLNELDDPGNFLEMASDMDL
jgi:hypothetical protein